MNLLVIGSKGFIGNSVYHSFSNKHDYNCWGCDISVDLNDANYFIINDTISDFDIIFKSINFDICINCSGSANVHLSLVDPFHDFRLNVLNVIHLLESLRKHRPNCKFINISSAAVYGNPISLPVEIHEKLSPVSPYGVHKLISEQLCHEYCKFFSIPTISLRLFSVYGPGLKKQIFWDWFTKSKLNSTIPLIGTGNESRDYIYIDDLVDAIDLVLEKANFNGSVLNIGNGQEIHIRDVAKLFFKMVDKEYYFNGISNYSDPINWKADIRTLSGWGYNPKVSLNDGIFKFIEWAKGLN